MSSTRTTRVHAGGALGFVKDTLVSMATDAAAPWYAILSNTRSYEEIRKDPPSADVTYADAEPAESVGLETERRPSTAI